MKISKFLVFVLLTSGVSLATSANARFIVDDFNTDTTFSVVDVTADGSHAAAPVYSQGTGVGGSATPITSGNTVWNTLGGGTATRFIYAELDSGDAVSTEICSNCQAAHVTADAGVTPSLGNYYFEWTGPSADLRSYYPVFSFLWGADLAGADWYVEFEDSNGVIASTAEQLDLPATAGPGSLTYLASVALPDFAPGTLVGYQDIERIRLAFNGVGALDGNIDNVTIPEPGTMALLTAGLAGFGWKRRRSLLAA